MTSTVHSNMGRGVSWLHLACGAYIVVWLSAGVASSVTSLPFLVKIATLALWVAMAAGRSMTFLGTMVTKAWPLVVMLLISVLYAAEVAQASQYTQGFGYLLIAFALNCFYSMPQFRRERHLLIGVMAADLAITGVRTLVALQTDPLLSRYLATTEAKRTAVYGSQSFAGLGGYSYAYSLAAVLLVLLYFLVRSPRTRIPIAVFLTAGLVILFELAFTTAIVLVLMLGAAFLVRDLVRRELQVLIYAAVLLGWITGFYDAILNALARQSWVTAVVRERLRELSGFLSGQVTSGSDLGMRLSQWRQSINTFWKSGPFGLAGGLNSSLDHGGHSQWLDLLASYGMYVLLLGLFLVFAWRVHRTGTTTEIEPLKRTWIYFLVLGFVNPLLFSTIVLTWMFFLPFVASWLGEKSASHRSVIREGATV